MEIGIAEIIATVASVIGGGGGAEYIRRNTQAMRKNREDIVRLEARLDEREKATNAQHQSTCKKIDDVRSDVKSLDGKLDRLIERK